MHICVYGSDCKFYELFLLLVNSCHSLGNTVFFFFSTLIFQLCDLICVLSLSGKTGEVIDTKYFDMWGGGMCDLHCVPAAHTETI